jgi:tRNA dimethylallyltransferase
MKKIIIISGPTATGKSSLAIELAQTINAEIVNFDSLLFYKELNIGTAKPSRVELLTTPHHLIDISSISSPLNAADFARQAQNIITSIHQNGLPVILVGGSGFYLQALVAGMWASSTVPLEVTQKSNLLYASEGIAPFRKILELEDPENFNRLHMNDHYRIRRAVEHFWTHAQPFSQSKEYFDQHKAITYEWDMLHCYLDIPKEDHLHIIEKRTHKMIQDGLVHEVEQLLAMGFSGLEKPLQSIGYKETIQWIQGIFGYDQKKYIERIIISTRQLAKAQRTWFKTKEKEQFDPRYEAEELLARVRNFMVQE